MFRNVLIGVDGRQGGRDAMALATRLAASGATLTLAHVETAPVGVVTRMDRTRSDQLLSREREAAGLDAQSLNAENLVCFALTVGGGLHELAEDHGADLLVVGSTHRGLVGRLALGDDCAGALNGAPCAVAVATRGLAGTGTPVADPAARFRSVGVGLDFSPESQHALAVARDIARRHGARLKVIHVVSLPEVSDERPLPADWPREIDELIERSTERLTALGGVDTAVSYGGPGEELAQFSGGVDLTVVGSRGFGPLERLFHGSVSHYLVQHARSPVLVLPRRLEAKPQSAPAGTAIAVG